MKKRLMRYVCVLLLLLSSEYASGQYATNIDSLKATIFKLEAQQKKLEMAIHNFSSDHHLGTLLLISGAVIVGGELIFNRDRIKKEPGAVIGGSIVMVTGITFRINSFRFLRRRN